jgi:hypothetical protein
MKDRITSRLKSIRALPWRVRFVVAVALISPLVIVLHYVLHQSWVLVLAVLFGCVVFRITDEVFGRDDDGEGRSEPP